MARVSQTSLNIQLTEPALFVTTPGPRAARRGLDAATGPAILRGLLVLKLSKKSRISSIEIELIGRALTEWPEGIGARRLEVSEEHELIHARTVYFDASATSTSTLNRRAVSLGPRADIRDYEHDDPFTSTSVSRRPSFDDPDRPSTQRHARSASVMPPIEHNTYDIPSPPYTTTRQPPIVRMPSTNDEDAMALETFRNNLRQELQGGPRSIPGTPNTGSRTPVVMSAPPTAPPSPTLINQLLSEEPLDNIIPHNSYLSTVPSSATSIHSSGSSHSVRGRQSRNDLGEEDKDIPSGDHDREEEVPPQRPAYPSSQSARAGSTSSVQNSIGRGRPPTRPPSITMPLSEESSLSDATTSYLSHLVQPAPSLSSTMPSPSDPPSPYESRPSAAPPAGPPLASSSIPKRPSSNDNTSRERGRRHSTRFSLASTVSHLIKDVGHEVKEAVLKSSGRSISRLRSREGEAGPSLSGLNRERTRSRGFGDEQDRTMVRGRKSQVVPLGDVEERSRSKSKSRFPDFSLELGGGIESWKEFRSGTYTYPISFALPGNSPPSLSCDFGSVSYRLKATVHRAGAFTPKLNAVVPVTLISTLGPDATDENENILVERQWEDKLRYLIGVEGKAFPIGGLMPLNLTLMPLDKIRVWRVGAILEEKTDYYAHERKVARHDPMHRFELVSVRFADKTQHLLPIISDSPAAALSSPLAPYVVVDTSDMVLPSSSTVSLELSSDVATQLLTPSGPWKFRFDIQLPDCSSDLHFTNKSPTATVVVSHTLKVILRVDRGDDTLLDAKGNRKQFDIIVETPIHILSCRSNPEWTHLPTYSQLSSNDTPPNRQSGCRCHDTSKNGTHSPSHHRAPTAIVPLPPILGRGGFSAVDPHGAGPSLSGPAQSADPPTVMHFRTNPHPNRSRNGSISTPPRSPGPLPLSSNTPNELASRTEQFARLIAGQESEAGETPPAYVVDDTSVIS